MKKIPVRGDFYILAKIYCQNEIFYSALDFARFHSWKK
jgi:hypothetical protein